MYCAIIVKKSELLKNLELQQMGLAMKKNFSKVAYDTSLILQLIGHRIEIEFVEFMYTTNIGFKFRNKPLTIPKTINKYLYEQILHVNAKLYFQYSMLNAKLNLVDKYLLKYCTTRE